MSVYALTIILMKYKENQFGNDIQTQKIFVENFIRKPSHETSPTQRHNFCTKVWGGFSPAQGEVQTLVKWAKRISFRHNKSIKFFVFLLNFSAIYSKFYFHVSQDSLLTFLIFSFWQVRFSLLYLVCMYVSVCCVFFFFFCSF